MSPLHFVKKGAQFSIGRVYRYALWRTWEEGEGHVMFIGLNPSTADENVDDPTIRRCIGFAKAWGFGGVYMLNLFAYRSTDPKGLTKVSDPIGPENDQYLRMYGSMAAKVVAAWGGSLPHPHRNRGYDVSVMLGNDERIDIWCLGFTQNDEPRHPLYLPRTAVLELLP